MNELLQQLQALCKSDHFLGEDDLPDGFELVEDGDWTQDGKYQNGESVYKHTPTGRHFSIDNSRSGSYHTDWYYLTPTVNEVEPKVEVITKTTWVVKKDEEVAA